MPSELEKVFAKRRSQHTEDVTSEAAVHGGEAKAFKMPPWLEGAVFVERPHSNSSPVSCETAISPASGSTSGKAEASKVPQWLDGAVFVERPSAEHSSETAVEAHSGMPPWLKAAQESGVIFYDQEGKEVVIPSSQVGEFKAALQTVSEFEPGSTPGSSDAHAVGTPAAASQSGSAGERASAKVATASDGGNRSADKDCGNRSTETEASRLAFKAKLQKRYFELLRAGLAPNDAAARAILEAANSSAQEQPNAASQEPMAERLTERCRSEAQTSKESAGNGKKENWSVTGNGNEDAVAAA